MGVWMGCHLRCLRLAVVLWRDRGAGAGTGCAAGWRCGRDLWVRGGGDRGGRDSGSNRGMLACSMVRRRLQKVPEGCCLPTAIRPTAYLGHRMCRWYRCCAPLCNPISIIMCICTGIRTLIASSRAVRPIIDGRQSRQSLGSGMVVTFRLYLIIPTY